MPATKQVCLILLMTLVSLFAYLNLAEAGHKHHHGGNYQYAEVPHKGVWRFGYKRGNHHHWREHHEQGHHNQAKGYVHWADHHGHGKHYYDYHHHDHHHGHHHHG